MQNAKTADLPSVDEYFGHETCLGARYGFEIVLGGWDNGQSAPWIQLES